MATSLLPPFLTALDDHQSYQSAVFHHKQPLGSAHALWWPTDASPSAVILFIPGNPGLVEFYIPFLAAIHDVGTPRNVAILAHAMTGHTSILHHPKPQAYHGLTEQIQSHIEALDAIKTHFGKETKVILIGHSIGAWIALQVLKAREDDTHAVFMLFPTISNMATTPNGKQLSWLFRSPGPFIISRFCYLLRFLPVAILSRMFAEWPEEQILVLRSLLHSPVSSYACLRMAGEEMETVREPDIDLLNAHRHRICTYFADHDDWVADQKDRILRAFHPDAEAVKVTHGDHGVPHAFCINHGEDLAKQCCQWLIDVGVRSQ